MMKLLNTFSPTRSLITGAILLALPLAALFAACPAEAKIPVPGRTDSYVNDNADMLNKVTENFIERANRDLKDESRNRVEIIVTTFESLEGWDFEDFAEQYGEKWRLTKEGRRDNGIIILVVKDQNSFNIGVGQNLRGIITPKLIDYIKKNVIEPQFSRGNFSQGIYVTVYTFKELLEQADIPETNYLAITVTILVILTALAALVIYVRKHKAAGQEQ
jgi:uncharacterized membrane protein YgcG